VCSFVSVRMSENDNSDYLISVRIKASLGSHAFIDINGFTRRSMCIVPIIVEDFVCHVKFWERTSESKHLDVN
jgi:hypothetical protein